MFPTFRAQPVHRLQIAVISHFRTNVCSTHVCLFTSGLRFCLDLAFALACAVPYSRRYVAMYYGCSAERALPSTLTRCQPNCLRHHCWPMTVAAGHRTSHSHLDNKCFQGCPWPDTDSPSIRYAVRALCRLTCPAAILTCLLREHLFTEHAVVSHLHAYAHWTSALAVHCPWAHSTATSAA